MNLRRKYSGKALYLTSQRHLNGMMHQHGAFSGLAPYYNPRKF
ncbi:hypothetical protein [Desulforamulus ferrireducens]|nr:hypothetical protein [Desulforamulus ferrireducens]